MTDPDSESQELGVDERESKRSPAKKSKETTTTRKEASDGKKETPKQDKESADENCKITEAMLNTIRSEQKRTGVSDKQILGIKAISAKTIPELTVKEFNIIMAKFKATGDLDRGGERCE